MCIYILVIYLLSLFSDIYYKFLRFAWLTGYALRPVLLSNTVHTDSFTAYNNK